MAHPENTKPWYRHLFVWLIISFPAFSVIGGLSLLVFSLNMDLGLVSDDYYKRGKAINAALDKDRQASTMGYHGVISYSQDGPSITATLTSTTGADLPEILSIDIMHATRGGMDNHLQLISRSPGLYHAPLGSPLPAGPWEIRLSTNEWRIHGRMQIPQSTKTSLSPRL